MGTWGVAIAASHCHHPDRNMGTKFEDILSLVGDRGRWQFRVFLFSWLEGILIGFHHLSSAFLGFVPEHHCNYDDIEFPSGWSDIEKKNFTIPVKDGKYEECKMYDVSSAAFTSNNYEIAKASRTSRLVACTNWTFAKDMGETIVSDWNLVCDRTALLSTVQGSYMGGVFVGCLFWGWASDKFGRRPSILVASLIQIVSTVIAAFSPNYIMFIFFRFIIAFSVSGVFECAFVLVMEIVSPELRTPFGIMTQFPFAIGVCLLPLVAYFIRDWNHLQLAISLPCLVLTSYYWFMPESPRWLIQARKFTEAKAVLTEAAKENGKNIPDSAEFLEMIKSLDEKKDTVEATTETSTFSEKFASAFHEIKLLFATPQMRKRTFTVFITWLVIAMVYYGLSFNSKNIGGDIYISMFINGVAEGIACLVIIPALAKLGRVKIYTGTFILSGVACLAVAVILWVAPANSYLGLIISLAMTGKFFISGTFALAYLYTAELFPTPVRNVAVGGASTFARVGSMSAPYIVDILGRLNAGIPTVIFGAASIIAGLLSLLLPETLNKKLPETVADVERCKEGPQDPETETNELKQSS